MKNQPKFIILLCCAIIGYIYFNYPIHSERTSFIIIFLCLSTITLTVVKHTYKDNTPKTYEEHETQMDELYKKEGIFKYVNDGFYITRNGSMQLIKWDEIIEVNRFYITIEKNYYGGLEIVTKEKSIEINYSDSPGFEKFTLELNSNLHIDPSWTVDYMLPKQIIKAGVYKNNLYTKNNLVTI